MKEKQTKQERMIEYAASLGITLTVVDRPSSKPINPEKLEESNKMLAQMDLSFLKNRNK